MFKMQFFCQVFFPVRVGYLYYVVCFDFLKKSVKILDNVISGEDIRTRYGIVVQKLVCLS